MKYNAYSHKLFNALKSITNTHIRYRRMNVNDNVSLLLL